MMVGVGRQFDDLAIPSDDNVPQGQHRLELGAMKGRVADGKLAQEVVSEWIEGIGGPGHGHNGAMVLLTENYQICGLTIFIQRSGSHPTCSREHVMGTSCKKPGRQEQEEKAMTKEDVLLPQDAQAVDPSKLSALTPEVVSFPCAE